MPGDVAVFDASVADNAAVSGAVSLIGGHSVVGVTIPDGWVTADLGFAVALAVDGTYVTVGSDVDGSDYVIPDVVASRYYPVDPVILAGAEFVKLTSSVNQTGGPLVVKVHARRLGG